MENKKLKIVKTERSVSATAKNEFNSNFSQTIKQSANENNTVSNIRKVNSDIAILEKNNEFNNTTIKNILEKMVNVKKTNIKLSNDIMTDRYSSNNKERLISGIKKEINHLKNENDFIKQNCVKTDILKEKSESNQKAITGFHKRLNNKYHTFAKTV